MRYIASLLVLMLLAVSGCAGVQNKVEAQLMPEAIAKKKIIARHFGQRWADNPTGVYAQGFGFLCGKNGKGPMPYNEIMRVLPFLPNTIFVESGSLLLMGVPCQLKRHVVAGHFSQQDIDDIVDALVSLGADIDEVKRE